MLNKNDESGHLSLVPVFRGKAFSFSLLSMMLALGLSYMAYYVEIHSLYTHFVEFFQNHKWLLILLNASSASIEMII